MNIKLINRKELIKTEGKNVYPKIPEANWWVIRNKFSQTIPTIVDAQYLMTLLNLKSKAAGQNLIPNLKQMKIIDSKGKPLPRANDWRNDQTYAEVCAAIVSEIYPQQLTDLFPELPEDANQIKRWFKQTALLGEGAAQQAAAMFILLKTAKIKNKLVVPKTNSVKDSKTDTKNKTSKETTQQKSHAEITLHKESAYSKEIAIHLHFTENMTIDQIDNVFSCMKKHIYNNQ